MEPVWHIVLNISYPDGRIVHDSVICEFEGNRQGFKLAVTERNRLEAEYSTYHPVTTENGGTVCHEVEMW